MDSPDILTCHLGPRSDITYAPTFGIQFNIVCVVSGEQQEVGAGGEGASASKDMVETARVWARPVQTELEALATLKKLLER